MWGKAENWRWRRRFGCVESVACGGLFHGDSRIILHSEIMRSDMKLHRHRLTVRTGKHEAVQKAERRCQVKWDTSSRVT